MSKYELSFVRPMKANGLSFLCIIVISGEKWESFIFDCWSKRHNLLFFSHYGQMNVSDRICSWRQGSSCFINQTGLQPALQVDPWDITCYSRNCSSYYLVAVTTTLTRQLTLSLVTELKMLPCTKSLWLTECYCYTVFFPVCWVYTSLNIEVMKKKKRQLGKLNIRLHECGICWAPVVREATQSCNLKTQIPGIFASCGLLIFISFLNVCIGTGDH